MASFFSLQPSQESPGNLSKFASATPGLEHVGSSQTYLDPSGKSGETLHSPFDEPGNTATSGARGGNLMTPVGDDSGGVDTGGTSAQTGARTPVRSMQQQQQPSGMTMSPDQIQALQTIGGVQQGLSAIPKSLVDSLKSTIKSSPEGAAMSDADIDSFIQSLSSGDYGQTAGGLSGDAYAGYYESLVPKLTEAGFDIEGYNLGDTNLDTDWLGSYTTGTRPGGSTQSTLDKFQLGDIQSALGVGSAAITGDPAQIAASLNRFAPNVAKYLTDNTDVIGKIGNVSQTLGGAWSLYQGIQSQNPTQIAAGIGSLISGAGQTIGVETIAQLAGVSTGTISTALGAIGGVTGIAGLYSAIESGDPVQALLSAASIYGTLSTVAPAIFTPLTTLAAQALIAVAPTVAASLGVTVGTTGATVAGISTAVVGAAMAPLAMVVGPYIVASVIQMAQAMGPDKANARQLGIRVKNIYGQLPGELQQLASIPQITAQLDAASTPDEAAAILTQLNKIQKGFQEGGWESHMKSGVTQVQSVGEGGMEASFPEVQKALMDASDRYMPELNLARLRAQDLLEKSGWTPAQIQSKTGRYIPPQEWAQLIGRETYNSSEAGNLGSGGGPNSVRYNPWMQTNFEGPGRAAYQQQIAQAELEARMRAANNEYVGANPGVYLPQYGGGIFTPTALTAFRGFQPGGIEQGLANLGFGNSFGWGARGFGTGLSAYAPV